MYLRTLKVGLFLICSLLFSVSAMANAIGTTQRVIKDSAITTAVKGKYIKERSLDSFDINVKTQKGVVYLSGEVNTDEQFNKAVSLATATNGVKQVDAADLRIKKGRLTRADLTIVASIEGNLLRHNLTERNKIDIDNVTIKSREQEVYLTGQMKSKKEKNQLLRIVKKTDNVKKVHDEIDIV